ncbi:hypothetical protein MBLNU13_g07048t2 [Cladosporium sp. NU13]
MDAHSSAKQSKVRKGTHSCRECKRRKVRCIFASPSDVLCNMCKKRGSSCISQWDTSVAISQSTTHTSSTSTADSTPSDLVTNSANTGSSTTQMSYMPRLPVAPTPPSSKASPAGTETQNYSTLTRKLLRVVPSHGEIAILLARMDRPPSMYYQFDYRSCCSSFDETPKPQALIPDLRQPDNQPILLAKQMFLFAAALRQIPRNDSIPGLMKHHHEIMDELAESAISNITTNDALLGSLEGLELIILEGFYHMDCGDARRAWITNRRAVVSAQLLGLHRPGHHRFKIIDTPANLNPEAMWVSVVYMVLTPPTMGSDLIARLGNVAGRILERNRIEVPQQALDLTKDIDQELVRIAEQMPAAFWRPLDFSRLARDTQEASNEIRRALDHGRYYNLVIQLHLPHMLCPSHASQRMYSKIACVNAGREILSRHVDLQSFEPAVSRCRMIDFPALIAGMALMLAHAISHCGKKSENMFAHQRSSDRAMVERTLENMEFVSELQQDTLLVKFAKLLTELLVIEEDAAKAHRYGVDQSQDGSETRDYGRNMLIARAPFLGGIRLSKEGIAAAKADQDSGLSESTSIGGIGAIHVNNLRLPETEPTRISSDSPGQQSNVSHIPPLLPDNFVMQGDYSLLDGTASLDDWAFLGTDTAFFESLMREAGDMPIAGGDFLT